MNTIKVKGTSLIDDLGRERIFNGVNIVDKGSAPDKKGVKTYKYNLDDNSFKRLKKRGINIIRLGVIWDAVEHTMGVYNEDYIDNLLKVADLCEKYGIYFYLDMHQDLYSADYSDGAPKWATLTNSYKYKQPKLIWAEGYFFSKAVHSAIDNFWNNTEIDGIGIQDRFIKMWQYVADKFKDKPALLGFDIYNEPVPGSPSTKIVKNLLLSGINTIGLSGKVKRIKALTNIIKGNTVTEALAVLDDENVTNSILQSAEKILCDFDVKTYYPFFKRVATAIREVTDKGMIIMENSYFSNTGIPCRTPRLVYDNRREPNMVFAPHAYDLTVDSVLTNTASNARVDHIFAEHKRTQERLNVPVIVGEWGGMVPGDEEYPHLEFLISLFDKNKWSQTYWHYSSELIDTKIMKIIARPYPQAVCGEINSYGFNRKTNTFTLEYNSKGEDTAKTEIFLPSKPLNVVCPAQYELTDNKDSTYTLYCDAVKGINTVNIILTDGT